MEGITIEDPVLGERDFIIAEDEVAGALGTGQCPNGGVHVYDATGDLETDARARRLLEHRRRRPDRGRPLGACTAHVFQLDHAQQLMTIAFYNGGVRVVDLTGLVGLALGKERLRHEGARLVPLPDSDTWAVKAPKMSRDGFYLLRQRPPARLRRLPLPARRGRPRAPARWI